MARMAWKKAKKQPGILLRGTPVLEGVGTVERTGVLCLLIENPHRAIGLPV